MRLPLVTWTEVPYWVEWLRAFAMTQTVEVPLYLRAVPGGWLRRALVAFGASALTHPVVWFVFPALGAPLRYPWAIALAELFAVAAEATWLAAFGVRRPIAWSLAANAASLSLGLLSSWVLGIP